MSWGLGSSGGLDPELEAMLTFAIIASLCLSGALSLPPDKASAFHIIKARSIDLNNAHGLSLETRLDKAVEPTGYRLELEPYLDDGIFKGHVRINVTWLNDAEEISIHCAHELEITDSEVRARYPKDPTVLHKVYVKEVIMNVRKPIATIRLERPVPLNSTGFLEFSFTGNLETASTEAFFKTTYKTDQEVDRTVAATQLRPNNARRMFPCFDEPGYKTPFELSVVRPRSMVALSNVPVASSEEITGEPDSVWDHFERTPPMSTFTLGLVIADLKMLDTPTHFKDDIGNDIELRVWGRPEFLSALQGMNEKLSKVFCELTKMWQVPLPLRRLDVVALPNYQGMKPADNWGLVVFKESDMSNMGYVQLAQELSYQWLGALTTPAWWSDAHLNKALVGYIAAETAYKINNGFEVEGRWPLTVSLYSLYYELSKRYPHSRITGMKQETTCIKIELLFRMFNYTLGGDTFKKAIKMFLETYKFKTFTGDDLWSALNTAAVEDKKITKDIDLQAVANTWIDKDRLPVVMVERNYDKKSISVSQKVFLRERPHDVPDAARLTWWTPLVVIREDALDFSRTTPAAWLRNKQITINNMPGKDQFVIVNPEEIGPFPVNYDAHNWYLLSQYLQTDKRPSIPALTRAKLLHDAWNLAYAGELSFASALNMTLFMKTERNHLVWDPVFTMIDHVGRHICQCIQAKFQTFARMLLTPLYEELGEEKEGEEGWKKQQRSYTKSFLCSNGYKPCIKNAQDHYSTWMQAKNPDEGNPIPNQYFCSVFRYGSKKEWEFGLQRVINFPSSRKQSERTYLLKTLAGCPIDEWRINRILNITILEGNGNFTENDLFLIFSMLTGSSQGYTTLFHFLNNNFDFLKEKFAHKTNLWDSLISSATAEFKTQDGLEMVSNFYMSHQGEFASSEHIIEKSIKNIREEVKWTSENIPVIEKWLDWYIEHSNVKDDKHI